jgi:hypothetical protein
MTAGGQGVSTPKLAYAQNGPLFAAGRAACAGPMISWAPSSGSGGTVKIVKPGKQNEPSKPSKPKKKKH